VLAKEKLLKEFLSKFQLSPKEEQAFERDLKAESITPEFFDILKKISQIREECKKILQENQYRAA
jgi:hypothetical protein